jgi:hypothetical protein
MRGLPLIRVWHEAPGLRRIGKRIPVHWFFQWVQIVVPFAGWFSLHARKQRRYIWQAMNGGLQPARLREIARKHLTYRKWRTCLTYAWPNVADHYHDWVSIEGEEHLLAALKAERGAILLSGHSYGFSRMVPPVLAEKGHSIFRTGKSIDPERWEKLWGRTSRGSWQYLNYEGDGWRHLLVLNRMRQALEKNAVLHIGIRGFPQGDSDLEIDFCYKKFFLDPQILRLMEILKAPVLPCFAVCDDLGKLITEIMRGFGALYSHYLREFPEFANIWARVIRQEEF